MALRDLFDEQIEKAKQRIPIENPKVYKDCREMLDSPLVSSVFYTAPMPPSPSFERIL